MKVKVKKVKAKKVKVKKVKVKKVRRVRRVAREVRLLHLASCNNNADCRNFHVLR